MAVSHLCFHAWRKVSSPQQHPRERAHCRVCSWPHAAALLHMRAGQHPAGLQVAKNWRIGMSDFLRAAAHKSSQQPSRMSGHSDCWLLRSLKYRRSPRCAASMQCTVWFRLLSCCCHSNQPAFQVLADCCADDPRALELDWQFGRHGNKKAAA